ncbi:MAG: hypothetical protein K2M34_05115 [Alphaproteobacteria bacterium]|nr:hypothetical protein [Alphaproteobacteria bacterium]
MNNIFKLFVGGFIAISSVTVCMADDIDTSSTKTPAVTARMDCKTLKAKIDELSANGKSDELSRFQLQYRKDCVVRASGLRTSYRGGALPIASASADTAAVVAAATPAPVVAEESEPVSEQAAATTEPVVAENTTDASQATETVTVEISAAQQEMCERLPDAIGMASDDARDTLQSTFDEYCNANVAAPDAVIKTTMMVLGPVETDEEKYARMAENLDAGLCPDGTTPNKYGCCGDEVFTDLGNLEFACCPKDGGNCFPPVK